MVTLALLTTATILSACGGSNTSSTRTEVSIDDEYTREVLEDEDEADDGVKLPQDVVASQRRLDALVAAYAPISTRVSFLVSAETLRADAVDSDAGDSVELERAGTVRMEIRRMRSGLRTARPKVLRVEVAGEEQRTVRQHLIDAIVARERALVHLERMLDAEGSASRETMAQSQKSAWKLAWQQSQRSAREALTIIQEQREELGLEPTPEGLVR